MAQNLRISEQGRIVRMHSVPWFLLGLLAPRWLLPRGLLLHHSFMSATACLLLEHKGAVPSPVLRLPPCAQGQLPEARHDNGASRR